MAQNLEATALKLVNHKDRRHEEYTGVGGPLAKQKIVFIIPMEESEAVV